MIIVGEGHQENSTAGLNMSWTLAIGGSPLIPSLWNVHFACFSAFRIRSRDTT